MVVYQYCNVWSMMIICTWPLRRAKFSVKFKTSHLSLKVCKICHFVNHTSDLQTPFRTGSIEVLGIYIGHQSPMKLISRRPIFPRNPRKVGERKKCFITVYWVGNARSYRHACAIRQWCHPLAACVKACGEHFERSCVNKCTYSRKKIVFVLIFKLY